MTKNKSSHAFVASEEVGDLSVQTVGHVPPQSIRLQAGLTLTQNTSFGCQGASASIIVGRPRVRHRLPDHNFSFGNASRIVEYRKFFAIRQTLVQRFAGKSHYLVDQANPARIFRSEKMIGALNFGEHWSSVKITPWLTSS